MSQNLLRADGTYTRLLAKLARVDVLVLDDLALTPLQEAERRDLLEVLEDRYGTRSTIVTSQMPPNHWHEAIARGHRVKTMTLPAEEFLRRFLLHVGLFANRTRTAKLARCRQLLAVPSAPPPGPPEAVVTLMQRLTGVDLTRCPVCRQGRLRVVAVFGPSARPVLAPDTS